jgi:hypothetical protein
MNRHALGLTVFVAVIGAPTAAHAYVGPGAGVTLIASFVGLLLAVVVALWAVISWPIRRLRKKRKEARAKEGQPAEPGETP